MTSRDYIFHAIEDERDYQEAKWGTNDEHPHDLGSWVLIMEGELQEAKDAFMKAKPDEILKEILQVITVGVACLEQHGVVTRWSSDK